ncbi:MAG: endonuclease/exonuclease/phosphatase family protein [Rhodobacteraceae bacterium]|nr:endonuclease/exonuclease/phosphatase family protein [Paracoccaceae bacterium]
MGVSSRFPFHARYRDGPDCDDDRRQAPRKPVGRRRWGIGGGLIAACLFGAGIAPAEPYRFATYNTELARDGPGLLLRDILAGEDADVGVVAGVVAHVAPDVLLLQAFDYDLNGHALAAFAERVGSLGVRYPYRIALAPNSGLATGRDLNRDGRLGGPRDAQGYGRFRGQGGMAVLSSYPIWVMHDFTDMLWADLPGNATQELAGYIETDVQRLSSVGHWVIGVQLPGGAKVALGAFHATPPVFDGPEDRNGWRNHDEAALWLRFLDGALAGDGPGMPFVLMGDANLDPADGDGRAEAMDALLSDPRLQDVKPRSVGGIRDAALDGGANTVHRGDPALDTADWRDDGNGPGNLRVDYVLPGRAWRVVDAGVFWPAPEDPLFDLLGDESAGVTRHRLVWVDLVLDR